MRDQRIDRLGFTGITGRYASLGWHEPQSTIGILDVRPPIATVDIVPDSLSIAQARRIALAAQGFGSARTPRPGSAAIAATVNRLGVLQIDSVNVFERSHYLPVLARLGSYDREVLDRMTLRSGARYLEYWAHEAAFIPAVDRPLFQWRMDDFRTEIETREPGWFAAASGTLERLRSEIAARGPLPASAFDRDRPRRAGWWQWDEVKRGLERLFATGDLVAAGRHRFERVYALPEQVLAPQLLDAAVPRDDAIRTLLARSARAHGVGTERDLADYYRIPLGLARPAIRELLDTGELSEVRVEGWRKVAYLHRDARRPRRVAATALLSPFDPVVWERERALRLFDFRYRIEIYTPAARRVYGYYCLPVLLDDALVGRVDLKNDRADRVLRVRSAWAEDHAAEGTVERTAQALRDAAHWQGLDDIEVEDRGNLSAALRHVLAT